MKSGESFNRKPLVLERAFDDEVKTPEPVPEKAIEETPAVSPAEISKRSREDMEADLKLQHIGLNASSVTPQQRARLVENIRELQEKLAGEPPKKPEKSKEYLEKALKFHLDGYNSHASSPEIQAQFKEHLKEIIAEYDARFPFESSRPATPESKPAPEPPPAAPTPPSIERDFKIGYNPHSEKVSGGKPTEQIQREAIQTKQKDELLKIQNDRSEKFAAENGLTELRNAKIAAEKAAYEEDLKHHKNPLRRVFEPMRSKRDAARRKADEATLAWSKALKEKTQLPPDLKIRLNARNNINSEIYYLTQQLGTETDPSKKIRLEKRKDSLRSELASFKLTPEEQQKSRAYYEALVISKRDTIIAPNALRTQARIDALNSENKSTLGKVLHGLEKGGKTGGVAVLKGLNAVSGGIGKGLFKLLGNKKLEGEELEREQAKYKRAGQIIMGATIGSVMGIAAGPGGLAAAAGIIGYSTLRTVLGTAAGTGAGYGADFINKRTFDKSTKEDYRKQVRNTNVHSIDALKAQQLSEKHGSRENRQKRAQAIRIGAAVVGGNVASMELGHFAHLPSVQHALHEHPPLPHHPAPEHLKGPIEKLQMEIGGKNLEGANLNDSNRLFGHFGLMLERDFANVPHQHTPAIDTYLKLLQGPHGQTVSIDHFGHAENHMAQAFGFETHGGHGPVLSEIMHKGDTIMLNKQGEVAIVWADHARPPHILIDAHGTPNTNIEDITKHLSHPYVAPGHTESGTPETPSAATTPETAALNPDNLGAAPEPPPTMTGLAEAVNHAREVATYNTLSTEHANLLAEYHNLQNSMNNPNYSDLLKHYNADIQAYREHLNAYTGHGGGTTQEAAATQPFSGTNKPELSNKYGFPDFSHGAETVTNGFHLNAMHGYEVTDPSTGETGLAFHGPHGPHFMEEVHKFAQQHPGQKILFDSPKPTMVNGTPQPFIADITYNPQGEFDIHADVTDPAYAGTKLNPSFFKKEIY